MDNGAAYRTASLASAESIADEHRRLAERIEETSRQIEAFFSAPANQTAREIERIIALLNDLSETAKRHFEHEETLMTENSFPGLIFHKRDHDYLLRNLLHFIAALSHGTLPFSNDIGANLRSWLTYHIKKYDDVYLAYSEEAISATAER